MTRTVVASRYANALADVVTATGVRPEQITQELRGFEQALTSSRELHIALTSPSVPASRKKAVIGRLGEYLKLSRIACNFLYVLIDRRRIDDLCEILDVFEVALDERLGFTRAEVASARELDERQRARLLAELMHLTGKNVRPKYTVDESLIGGTVARIGSTVYDGSVRGRLAALEKRLSAE
jgi:F-type H+-transporting ATPase subunit delta